ncbi:MAG: serine/threonine-protein kinase [Myxococcota bacterium]
MRPPTLFQRASSLRQRVTTLGPELQELQRTRLAGLATVVSVMGVLETTLWLNAPLGYAPKNAFFIAPILIGSFFVGMALRRRRFSETQVQNLAVVYEVALAIAIASLTFSYPWPSGMMNPSASVGVVWVAIYPMLIPNDRRRVVIATLLSAAVDPLWVFGQIQLGLLETPPAKELFRQFYPNVVVLLPALLGSAVIYKLGTALAEAKRLGAYVLHERLGEGGMGEVWRAEHALLARPAAVKLIQPAKVGPEARRRFEREAQATASLRSPHTIQLYDYGVSADGTYFYVMEMLEGKDLRTLVDEEGPQPPARVVHLLRQALHSIGEAHAVGFVHRDIKPANLFVSRRGQDVDVLKVLDFGLVQLQPGVEAGELGVGRSQVGEVLRGTPAFMAPEVALGEPADGRADLYALGCVAYWLLTGQLVFDRDTAMKAVLAHVNEAPVPPSATVPTPAALETIVLRLLEKDPEARFPEAEAVDAALRATGLEAEWDPRTQRAHWGKTPSSAPGAAPGVAVSG